MLMYRTLFPIALLCLFCLYAAKVTANTPKSMEAVVAIDLGDLYLRMETNGAKGATGKLIQYVPESVIAHERQTQIALSLLPKKAEDNTPENIHRELPDQYWIDVVTEQPEGYVVDANGDVHIYTAEAMAWLISLTNGLNGQEIEDFEGQTITLENDINLSEALWLPIAGLTIAENQFKGYFDGKQHVIEGLTMTNGPSYYYAMGLFGEVSGGTLTNIVLKDGYYKALTDGNCQGGFLANNVHNSIIDHCFVDCEMHIYRDMSPFVYLCDSSTISNCLVHSPLYRSDSWHYSIPGILVAYSYSTSYICNCVSIIDRMDHSEYCGLVGMGNSGKIENCYAYIGEFIDFGGAGGGLAPRNGITSSNYESGEIRNCYFNRIRNFVGSSYYIPLDYTAASENSGIIENTSSFVEEGRGHWKLTDAISFELESGAVTTNDLLEALNFKVELLNEGQLLDWCDDPIGFDNQQLPVFCGVNMTETVEYQTVIDPIILSPNPNNGVFTVTGENLKQIEVFDALGQRITSLQANGNRSTLDLSGQPAGVYLINVTDHNGKQCVKKVVKNN